jgi:hypothetical protein
MAIEIAHNTKYGDSYSTAYARIISLNIDYESRMAICSIAIYRSEEDRANGKSPVDVERQTYEADTFDEFFAELRADKIDARINPLADVYSDITEKENTKYHNGKKLYDEIIKEDGDAKEVSKYEKIAISKIEE